MAYKKVLLISNLCIRFRHEYAAFTAVCYTVYISYQALWRCCTFLVYIGFSKVTFFNKEPILEDNLEQIRLNNYKFVRRASNNLWHYHMKSETSFYYFSL